MSAADRPLIKVTVTGEPGAGKTTLIALIATALRAHGHSASIPHQCEGPIEDRRLDQQFNVDFMESTDEMISARLVEIEIVRRIEEMRKGYTSRFAALQKKLLATQEALATSNAANEEMRDALVESALLFAGQARARRGERLAVDRDADSIICNPAS